LDKKKKQQQQLASLTFSRIGVIERCAQNSY